MILSSEVVVVRSCSIKKVFLQILQYSQENNYARECEISKSLFYYRTRLVATSVSLYKLEH